MTDKSKNEQKEKLAAAAYKLKNGDMVTGRTHREAWEKLNLGPGVLPFEEMGEEKAKFLYGSGCKSCSNTGYRGRTGIFEILYISDEIRMSLLKGATATELREQAIEEGMVTLLKDGMLKVKSNLTTPAEVLRNAYTVD